MTKHLLSRLPIFFWCDAFVFFKCFNEITEVMEAYGICHIKERKISILQ